MPAGEESVVKACELGAERLWSAVGWRTAFVEQIRNSFDYTIAFDWARMSRRTIENHSHQELSDPDRIFESGAPFGHTALQGPAYAGTNE